MEVVKSLLSLMLRQQQQQQQQQRSCGVYTLSEFLQAYVPMLPSLDVLLRRSTTKPLGRWVPWTTRKYDDNDDDDANTSNDSSDDATELSLLLRYTLLIPNPSPRAGRAGRHQQPAFGGGGSSDRPSWNGTNTVRSSSTTTTITNSVASASTLAPLTKLQLPPTQSQSLESLIQDCIWTLLQEQQQQQQQQQRRRRQTQPHDSLHMSRSNRQARTTPRNVLCLGYEIAMEYNTTGLSNARAHAHAHSRTTVAHSTTGTTAVVASAAFSTHATGPTSRWRQRQLNAAVEYCQRHSPLFPVLHAMLGDDVLRFLLLHTSIFVPIVGQLPEGEADSCAVQPIGTTHRQLTTTGNYWQVVGPSLSLDDVSSSPSSLAWLVSPVAATSHVASKRPRNDDDDGGMATAQPLVESSGGDAYDDDTDANMSCRKTMPQSAVNSTDQTSAPRDMAAPTQVENRQRRGRRKKHRVRSMRLLVPPGPPSGSVAALAPLACLRRQPLFHSSIYTTTVGQGLFMTADNNSKFRSPVSSAMGNDIPMASSSDSTVSADDTGTTTSSSVLTTVPPRHPTLLAETLWHSMIDEYVRHQSTLCCFPKRPYSATTISSASAEVSTHSSITGMSIQLCLQIRQRHLRTNYHRLLRRHCPLPDNYHSMSLDQLAVNGYSNTNQVIAFVQSCIRAVIPSSFWCGPSKSGVCRKRKNHQVACPFEQRLSNESVFLQQTIPVFVSLRRHEQMTNSTLVQNLRISHMPWLASSTHRPRDALSPRIHHELDKLLVLSILRWLFHSYIIPLLQQVFYVTECEFHRKRVMFYRKPVWALFRTLSMKKVLDGSSDKATRLDALTHSLDRKTAQYQELKESDVAERLRVQSLGMSCLRFVPKTAGVRPIAMLSKRESLWLHARLQNRNEDRSNDGDEYDDDEKSFMPKGNCANKAISQLARHTRIRMQEQSRLPTNILLRDVFAVLSHEYSRNENLFGYGLMGMHHFYGRYRNFLLEWKDSACSPSLLSQRKRSQLYFGSVDVRHCYDNINQSHLMGVVDTVLTNESYVIQKYSVSHASDGARRAQLNRKRDVSMPDQFGSFSEKVQALAKVYHGSVFVDGVNFVNLNKQQIMDQLHEHLSGNMVVTRGRFGNRYLLQTKGIPQGSILSTLLCNFYYGDIEHRLLNPVASLKSDAVQCQLVARMVDDFIFVTTDVNALKDFFTTMHQGDTVRGVEINHEKTNTSISMSIARGSVESTAAMIELKTNATSGYFSWCGMLFDTASGDVRIDYSRFFEDVGSDGLPTVERVCIQGGQLAGQMQRFVRPRCLSILFDPFINSSATQALNYYQLIAYAAVKTAEHLFRCGNRVTSQSPVLSNAEYLVRCMQTTIEYSFVVIQSQLIKSYQSNAEKNCQPDEAKKGLHCLDRNRLRDNVAAWLGWRAFFDVFQAVPRIDFNDLAIHHIHVTCMKTKPIDFMKGNGSPSLEEIVASGRETMNICGMIQSLLLGTSARAV